MTAKRAGFKRGFRLSISSLLSLVLIVSTLSATSVPFANAASVTATGTNPSVCNQEVGNSTNVESSRVGNKCVVEFKNVGTTTWQVPTGITSAQVMVVAGGGSGGGLDWTGGGGAGGVITASAYSVTAGSNYTVVVGAGGASQTQNNTPGNDGGNSSFDGKVARGGGGGAGYGWNTSYTATGRDGGSGGGSGEDGSTSAPGSIPTGGASTQDIPAGFNTKYGNKGGDSGNLSGQQAGGGGGGAGAAGGNVASNSSPSNRQPGNGGDGVSLSIGGKTFNVAAGGGGASFGTKGVGGSAGGVKIGGDGGRGDDVVASRSTPGAGASNTGSGGGGTMASVSGSSGAGGSGIVVVAYDFQPSAPTITSITGENNSLSVAFTAPTNGANITGYKYSTNGGSTWSASTGSTSSPISIPSLTNGTSYAVQIRAVNGSADGVATATTNAIAGTSCSPTTNPSPPAGYTVLTFTSTTSCNWSIPSGVTAADVLIVGGGGAGGGGIGGGGGAGEFIETTRTGLTGGSSVLISVGAGGTSNNNWNAGNAGGQSQFASVIAYGGGGGGTNESNLPVASGGPNFGSQGGGGYNTSALTVGTRSDGITGFRNNGGAGSLAGGSNATGGGGGGAGGAGASGTTTNAGNGGLGKASSITGSSLFYAAGGGGGVNGASSPGFTSSIAAGNPGDGGSSIGGNGGSKATTNTDNQYGNRGDGSGSTVNSNGRPGAANTGSGGGGASNWVSGGAGGSGVVIVKYVNAPSITLSTSTISGNVNSAISSYTISNSGGPAASYSIPSADNTAITAVGLSFSTSTGLISGTPSGTLASRSITITATNTSGTSSATFSLAINNPACSPTSSSGGGFTILTFTSTTTCNWAVPVGVTAAEVLVVGGGGGGGGAHDNAASGGGGAGYVYANSSLSISGTIAISVGAGGTGGVGVTSGTPQNGNSGGNSTFGSVTALGGGGGFGGYESATPWTGSCPTYTTPVKGGTAATLSQAATGGQDGCFNRNAFGGGGQSATQNQTGGAGLANSITGTSVTYGTGGTGGTDNADVTPSAQPSNTGNGGTGAASRASFGRTGGTGGSGVVIVRYVNAPSITLSSSSITGTANSAITSYTINSTGGPAASYSISPALSTAGLSFSTSTGLISGTPTATLASTSYTITATNTSGTSTATFSLAVSLSCAAGGVCVVGDTGPGGGKVFYVEPSGGTFACGQSLSSLCKYLEAAPITGASAWTDNRYAWSGNINTAIGTTSTAIGSGYSNTLKMVRQTGAGTSGAGSAARGYRGGGLNDWYLPSKDELNQLYINRTVASASDGYWSSSEATATGAWDQGFGNGAQGVADPGKQQTTPVRPIRAFGSSAVESAIIYVPAVAGVTAPVRGATPVTAVTTANGYTGTVSWSSAPSTFAAATTYTATITLTASSGFTLTGVTANFFTVAGASTVTHSADSGTITAVFPATEGASQTITRTSTSPVSPVVAGTYTPTATASSGLTVAITIASGSSSICSISGGIVTFNAAGSCVVQYNQAGNASYTAATQVTENLTIGKGSQTITFGSLSNRTLGSGTYSISASSSSSLTVAFTTATASICTVASTTITLVAAGTCTINANQAGDSNYLAATQVQQSFTVATAITITTPTTGLSGTFNIAYSLTVSASGGSGSKTFAATGSLPAGVTISSGGVISGTPSTAGDFDLTVTATDANNATATTSSFRISIAKGVSSISLSVGTYTYTGSGLGPDSATTSGSTGAVTYAYAGRGSTSYTSSPTKPTAVGTYTVTATLAADANYASVSTSAQNFEITLATRTLTIDVGSFTSTYGMLATPPTLTSTASAGTGTKSYTSSTASVCTINSSSGLVAFVAPGTCTLAASIGATSTHASATASSISFTITSSTTTLSGLVLTTATISPTFASATTSYTASVLFATTAITVTPTRTQADATITVNGTAVNSGSASGSISLNVGSNTITVVVTAQDGVTTRTYTVTVTRAVQVFTITYAAGTGGSGTGPTSPSTVNSGATFTTPANTYTRTLYTFAGWSDGTNTFAAGATYPSSGSVSGNVTLTATWNLDACSTTTSTANGYTSIVIATVGTCGWVVPDGITRVDVLTVGGGGAGGTSSNGAGGGGGGGQVNAQTNQEVSGVITIQVGAGGTAQSTASATPGGNGGTTSFTPGSGTAITANGGSGGASVAVNAVGSPSATGFNGGGGSVWASNVSATNGTNGVGGFKGGASIGSGSDENIQAAGGGGGSGAVGANATSTIGGNGGAGVSNSYSGSATFYGGGGGGGKRTNANGSAGTGGSGGGGNGGRQANGSAGTANTGGGGGGSGGENVGGAGGSGVVIVRYATIVSYTYDANGGTGTAPSGGSVRGATTFTTEANPFTRTGYSFAGWNTAANGSGTALTQNATNTMPISGTSIVLYAQWTAASLVVTYDEQGGGSIADGSVNVGASISAAPTAPIRAGYTLTGWSTTSTGSVVTFPYAHSQTANFTLYAIWSANALTVTYDSKGGTSVTSGTVNTAASISSAPTAPTRTGYTFSAWSATDGGTAITFPYAHGQTANFTLFALWTAGTNTVIFDANSGSGTMSNQSITSGSSTALTRNTLTKSGYIFGGWNTNADGSSGTSYNDGQSVTITAGATLYARWLQDNYLELFGRGDVPRNTSYQVPTNNVYTAELWWQAPATFPTKTESFAQRTIFSLGNNVSTNLTLFANADHSFTIYMNNSLLGNYSFATDKTSWHHLALVRNGSALTFYFNGQSVLTNASLNSGTVGAGIRLGAFYDGARWGDGKFDQFKLWDVALSQAQLAASANTYNFSSDTPAAEDLILHYDFNDGTGTTVPNRASSANFNLSIVGTSGTTTYSTISPSVYSAENSVTYDGNGSTGGSVPITQTKLFGTSLTLATNSGNLVRAGYTFNGWNTAANGTGTSYAAAASYTLNAGLTLFARWTANSNSITYDNQSATTAQSGGSTSYTTGSAIATIPTTAPIKTGYTFAGWFTASSGGNQVTNGSLTPSSPFGTVTLYAQWTANSLTVTYNSKGGTAVTSGTVNTAASISSAPTAPTRTGYTFSAWSATDGGTAITFPYAHGQTANFTLFALWTANSLTVTYNSQSGSAVSNGTVATGASISAAPTAPTRTGYTLDGWSATETGTVVVFPYAHGQTANFTLFAKWTGNTNTITYDSKGGSAVANGSFVTGGSIAAAPTAPSRAGYTLAGWSLTDGGSIISYPYSPPGTSGITLYAIWTGVSCSPTSTTTGGYTIYTFTTAGTCFWTVPNGLTDVEVLAVAGGGGGGYAWDNAGAGGGAGGQVKTGTVTLGSILEVTVGAGGTAGIVSSTRGGSGANTVVSTITALGGTGGCAARATTCSNSAQATSSAAANGGVGGAGGASGRGGGGSNTTASATSTTAGGNGTSNSYSGSAVTYGAGGTGGTARGAGTNIAGTAGSVNTGNGGGGASAKSSSGEVNGGAGGSGLVVVRIASALTVAFDSQGGSAVSDTSTVTAGSISEPTAPNRSNYTFVGWFTATSGGTAITFPYAHGQTANFTLYARWTLNSYAIAFNANNGSGTMANQSVTHGVAANLNANLFTRANYVFHRWAVNADGTGTTYNNLAQVTLTAGTTLYAQWTANTYVVTYSYNNATGGNSTATSSFTTGGSVIVLPTPTRTGYTFGGWYSDSGLSSQIGLAGANYSPTGTTLSLNAYAKWTAIDYTFTYDGNNSDGGTVPTETSKQIGQTATVKANTGSLTRAGYTFVGWNTQSNGGGTNYLSGALFTVQSSNVTLYAKWSANSYTITYNSNGGSGSAQRSSSNVSTDTYTTGGSSVALPGVGTLTRSGYTFDGWNTSAAGSGTNRAAGDTYTTVSDVIFYAKWNAVTYTITYAGNTSDGGTTPTTGGYTTGQASPYSVVANTFTKTLHVFGGWNTAADGTGTNYSPGSPITTLSNITLYAIWIPQYTLHYAINGGSVTSGSLPSDQLYNANTSITSIFGSVARTGYTFGGWRNGSTTIAAGGSFTIVQDSVLTAIWTPIDYTISYDSDGGTTPPNSFTKQIGQSFEVGSAVTKPGYNFTGWKAGSSTVGAGATVVTGSSNISYTAQWTAKVYRISYDWNGGRGTAVSDVDYTFGTSAITLPLVGDRVKDGYNFAGWAESTNGSALGLTYTPSQTRTLYALWTLGNFTVTYDAGRGTVANSTVAVQNGSSTVLPLPTRANFVFNGWHTAVTGGSSVGSNGASFTPLASQTVYARWIQSSLFGITDSLTRIGSVITADNVSNTFSGANSNSSVAVSVPANALPAGTTINFDLVGNSSRAVGLLPGVTYVVSMAISWLTADETVPDTASGKPISVTITNSSIKAGAVAYAIVNNVSTLLGTATQDGSITVALTSDPEVVVAATKPGAPTSVAATSNGAQQSVVSWSAPSSNGGAAISGYTVTASPGTGTCTTSSTSCTISSLTNGTAYSFTVIATNSVGNSAASSAASATTAALHTVTFDAKGGSTVTAGSFLTTSTVSEPTAPTRAGYSFAGWSATDGGTVQVFPYAPGVATNITMYAKWDALDNAVTFDSKGGSSVTASVFSSGGNVSEPTAPTLTGFTFAGWSATDGGTRVTFPYAPGVVTDITLYAKWTAVSQSSSGSGGSNTSTAPADPAPSTGGTPVRSNVTVVAPVVVVGTKDAKVLTVEISTPAAGSSTKPPAIKLDAASEKFIADLKVVDGKLTLTPETGFSGRKTVTVTITENGTDRIIQIPLTVLPEPVAKPVLTPTASNRSLIRWTESPNAEGYAVLLNGKRVCTTTATSCSVKQVLGPDAVIEIVSTGGDRTFSQRIEADFRQNVPVPITRIVSATNTKATLSRVDTKALDSVVALIRTQGFGTVVISEISTNQKTAPLAAARIAAIKKYIDDRTGTREITFEIVPPASRTNFNNISVKG